MLSAGPSELLHLVGFLTGALLYGMLLVMVARPPARPDRLALATGVLGLVWNVGELGASATRLAGFVAISPWVHALSFTALGLLASVVVHSVARAPIRPETARRRFLGSAVAAVVYGCAALAGVMHMAAAAAAQPLPSPTGLTWLTIGLLAVIPALVAITRQQPHSARALWMAALAVVAVSALHLGRFHGAQESWPVELVGHHASIVLAFAILYQDYRFALADLFLKQALTLLVLVALVFGGFSIVEPFLTSVDGRLQPTAIALLLGIWASTAVLFPFCRRLVDRFVDRAVLQRADYGALVSRLSDDVLQCDSIEAVLSRACQVVAPSLNATSVTWEPCARHPPRDLASRQIAVWTAEAPDYLLTIGQLAGGRRLLSDDLAMLERISSVLARRIDALRLTGERYERMLQEREMRTLATEAELRALRAQINPHFLFNALTTLGYLIQQAPSRALKTLLDLTTLLRSVLRSEGEFTTLGRERELIDCYLQIERERFEERLEFVLNIPDRLAQCPVPSLIVQPLVENAVKHGIAGARLGGLVSVTATLEKDLKIVVRNTGAPFVERTGPSTGVGLENVRRRLRHYYGDDAGLTLVRDGQGATVATLRLPAADVEDGEPGVVTGSISS
jgi:two-component system LytT family sensor kinase